MTDGSDTNGLSAIGQLIENSIGADPKGIKAAELASKRVTGKGITLEQAKRILDRVDQRPAQLEQVAPGSPGKYESRQRSAGRGPALGQFATKVSESDRLAALDLGKAHLQRGEGIRIGEDLGSLLQRLVLINGNQGRRRSSITGHHHVISAITDVVQEAADIAPQLSHGNGLGHKIKCI